MKIVLIGSDDERARLRPMLVQRGIAIAAEAETLSAARALGLAADAFVIAAAAAPLIEELTPRELDVLELVAEGLSNQRIGARLGIAEPTVKSHVSQICAKLGAENRTDAVRIAVRRGIVAL